MSTPKTNNISSPCIQICKMDEHTQMCIGCGRTRKEIAIWRQIDEKTRKSIMNELPKRLDDYKNQPI